MTLLGEMQVAGANSRAARSSNDAQGPHRVPGLSRWLLHSCSVRARASVGTRKPTRGRWTRGSRRNSRTGPSAARQQDRGFDFGAADRIRGGGIRPAGRDDRFGRLADRRRPVRDGSGSVTTLLVRGARPPSGGAYTPALAPSTVRRLGSPPSPGSPLAHDATAQLIVATVTAALVAEPLDLAFGVLTAVDPSQPGACRSFACALRCTRFRCASTPRSSRRSQSPTRESLRGRSRCSSFPPSRPSDSSASTSNSVN